MIIRYAGNKDVADKNTSAKQIFLVKKAGFSKFVSHKVGM